MLFFLVSFVSFLLLLTKPLPLHFPSWVSEMRLLFVLLCQEFLSHSIQWLKNYRLVSTQIFKFPCTVFPIPNKNLKLRHDNVKEEEEEEVFAEGGMNVLDLPELALDLILEKLPPNGLLSMAKVCKSLRGKCKSGHFWERRFREKWGRVIGESARRAWGFHFASMSNECKRNGIKYVRQNWVVDSLSCVWPCSWFVHREEKGGGEISRSYLPDDSVMAWYLALESGRFWFPAQVYNREQNGHVGFLLSCYDAELSYDFQSDTFNARYPPHGQRATDVEEGVPWERIRAPPVETQPHELHISDCLHDLRPGDHIEIQWRRNREFPYGWWYGAVGHLESCDGDEHHCRCYNGDIVILEFNQYSFGSRWRKTVINRKNHREEGNESDGFYGGIRKLYSNHEISMWRRLWPNDVLQ